MTSLFIYLSPDGFCDHTSHLGIAGHAHESPHAGEVRTVGDNHVDFLVIGGKENKGYIIVYLLHKNLKPVPVDRFEGVVYSLCLPNRTYTLYPNRKQGRSRFVHSGIVNYCFNDNASVS